MRMLSILIVPALLMAACGDSDNPVAKTPVKKEHFLSAQQKVLEDAKAVSAMANDATARRQKELDKLK